jgi:hypothetical protein
MARSSLIAIALLAGGPVASADSVGEELVVGTTVATATTPAMESIGNRLAGTWEPSERWSFTLDVGATRSRSTTLSALANDAVVTSLAADFTANDHWSLRASVGYSPRVASSSFATIEADGLPGGMAEADVNLVSASWMTSLGLSASYDTAGDGDYEISASLSARASYYNTQQAIASLYDASGEMFSAAEMRDFCSDSPCSAELREGLSPQWTQVNQIAVGASITETAFQDTDLGLDAEYYHYDQDPTQAGYFALATIDGGYLGDGVAVAPMQFAVTPTIARRFGDVSATASLSYGNYIDAMGYELSAGLRVQVKFAVTDTTRLKLYAKLGSSWDVQPGYPAGQALSLALGARYSW